MLVQPHPSSPHSKHVWMLHKYHVNSTFHSVWQSRCNQLFHLDLYFSDMNDDLKNITYCNTDCQDVKLTWNVYTFKERERERDIYTDQRNDWRTVLVWFLAFKKVKLKLSNKTPENVICMWEYGLRWMRGNHIFIESPKANPAWPF